MDTEDNLPEENLEDTLAGGNEEADEEADNPEEGEDNEDHGDTVAGGADEGNKGGDAGAKGGEPSRGSKRIQELARKARDAELRAERAEAIAAERERNSQARQPSADDARRAREEKLAIMDPSERRDFENQERIQAMQAEIMQTRVQTQDILDKQGYAAKAERNPIYAKHKEEVERRYIDNCRKGIWYPRETYLAVVVGEAALKAKPNVKQKEEARERVNSAKGTPVTARSNVSTSSRNKGTKTFEELEKDLEDVVF